MDFDELDATEEVLQQTLLNILAEVGVPDWLYDFLREENLVNCHRFFRYASGVQDLDEKVTQNKPVADKVSIRNAWRRCRHIANTTQEEISEEEEKAEAPLALDADDTANISKKPWDAYPLKSWEAVRKPVADELPPEPAKDRDESASRGQKPWDAYPIKPWEDIRWPAGDEFSSVVQEAQPKKSSAQNKECARIPCPVPTGEKPKVQDEAPVMRQLREMTDEEFAQVPCRASLNERSRFNNERALKAACATDMPGIHFGLALPDTCEKLRGAGARWLTEAFHVAGTLPLDNEVTSMRVTPLSVDSPTHDEASDSSSVKFMLEVSYKRPNRQLHTKLFGKMPLVASNERRRSEEEAMFHRLLSASCPFRVPKTYFTDYCPETRNFIHLVEWLEQDTGLTPKTSRRIVTLSKACKDYLLPEFGLDKYMALFRSFARFIAACQNGELGDLRRLSQAFGGLEQNLPDWIPSWPQTVEQWTDYQEVVESGGLQGATLFQAKQKADEWATQLTAGVDFVLNVAPHLFGKDIRDRGFLLNLMEDMMTIASFYPEQMLYCTQMPALFSLFYPDVQLDNTFYYWTDVKCSVIEAGIFDWAGLVGMPFLQSIASSLQNGAEPRMLDQHEQDLIRMWLDTYHACGGSQQLTYSILYTCFKLHQCMSIPATLGMITSVLRDTPKDCSLWKTVPSRFWREIDDNRRRRVAIAQIDHSLEAWRSEKRSLAATFLQWQTENRSVLFERPRRDISLPADEDALAVDFSEDASHNVEQPIPDLIQDDEARESERELEADQAHALNHMPTQDESNTLPSHERTKVEKPTLEEAPVMRQLRDMTDEEFANVPRPLPQNERPTFKNKKVWKQACATDMPGRHFGIVFPYTCEKLQAAGAAWLTEAFHVAGTLPHDNEVTSAKVTPLSLDPLAGEAMGGSSVKGMVEVTYKYPMNGLHTKLFAKMPLIVTDTTERWEHWKWYIDEGETMFNRLLSASCPFKVPKTYFTDHCPETTNFIHLVEWLEYDKDYQPDVPYRIAKMNKKCKDYVLPKLGLEMYLALVRSLARLSAAFQNGGLGDLGRLSQLFTGLEPNLPGFTPNWPQTSDGWLEYEKAAQDRAFQEAVLSQAQQQAELWAMQLMGGVDFVLNVAPQLFGKEIADPKFLLKFMEDMMTIASFYPEQLSYCTQMPELFSLFHPNVQLDNGFYYYVDDECTQMEAGIFDWGGAMGMPFLQSISNNVQNGAEPNMLDEHEEDLIRTWLDTYHECGGGRRLTYKIVYTCWKLYQCSSIPGSLGFIKLILRDVPPQSPFWKSVPSRFCPDIEDNYMRRAIVGQIDHSLEAWRSKKRKLFATFEQWRLEHRSVLFGRTRQSINLPGKK